jgi:hypothetical protein
MGNTLHQDSITKVKMMCDVNLLELKAVVVFFNINMIELENGIELDKTQMQNFSKISE